MNSATASSEMDRVLLITIKVVLALVLLAPLIVMAPPLPNTFFPFIVGKALYVRTLIEIAFGLWVVLALRDPSFRLPRSWMLAIFAAYVFIVLLASVAGVSPQRSLWSTYERMQGFVDTAHWFLFIWVLTSVFRSWGDWRWLLSLNLFASILLGLLGLSQHFEVGVLDFLKATPRLDITLGNPTYVGAYMLVNIIIAFGFLGHSYLRSVSRPPAPRRQRRRKRTRRREAGPETVFSEFWWGASWVIVILLSAVTLFLVGAGSELTRVAFISLVTILAAFGTSYLISERQRLSWWRVFWMTAVVLGGAILFMSGTRGAVVGLAGGLLAFAAGYLLWGLDRRLRLASFVLIGTVLGLTLLFLSVRTTTVFEKIAESNVMLLRLANTGIDDASLTGRIDSALVGLEGFAARPILGWGPENFTIAYDRHVTAEIIAAGVTSFDQAHNKLIEELTTKGILGFAGYMAVWLYMLWIVARTVRRQGLQDQFFTLAAGAALTGYFVQNLFLFDTPGTVGQFYVLLGFVVYVDISRRARDGADKDREDAEPADDGTGLWHSRVLRSDASTVGALVVVGVVVSLAVYFANYGPYRGASTVLGSLNPSASAQEKREIFDEAIGAFPALANYLRIILFNQLTGEWGRLSAQDAEAGLAAAAREGENARRGEPEEWRIYLPLAALYQRAAPADPSLLERAGELVEVAARLAPERIEVVQMVVRQHVLEQDFEAAQRKIDAYLEKSPTAAPHFAGLERQIDQAIERQGSSEADR